MSDEGEFNTDLFTDQLEELERRARAGIHVADHKTGLSGLRVIYSRRNALDPAEDHVPKHVPNMRTWTSLMEDWAIQGNKYVMQGMNRNDPEELSDYQFCELFTEEDMETELGALEMFYVPGDCRTSTGYASMRSMAS